MLYQEKKSFVYLFSNVLIFILYYNYVFNTVQDGIFNPANGLSFWGYVFLIYIPFNIVFNIIIHIIFIIINKVTTNEEEPSFEDELDKLIELKSTRNTFFIFAAGFFLSMGSLAMDMGINTMFNILLFTMLAMAIMGDSSKIYFYRRGIRHG